MSCPRSLKKARICPLDALAFYQPRIRLKPCATEEQPRFFSPRGDKKPDTTLGLRGTGPNHHSPRHERRRVVARAHGRGPGGGVPGLVCQGAAHSAGERGLECCTAEA